MKVFYIISYNGDGSAWTEFYDSWECIEYLINDERYDERYMDGDGGSYGSFEADNITGISIGTMETIKTEEEEWA